MARASMALLLLVATISSCEPTTSECPEHCTCSVGALSDLVVECQDFQSHEFNHLLPLLAPQMQGFVSRLDITGSRIPVLMDDFLLAERSYSLGLTSIRLSDAGIEKISPRAFKSASRLEEVELQGNEMVMIPNEVFSTSCPKLRLLNLSHNKRLTFPSHGPFLRSHSLQELDVSSCRIIELRMQSLAKMPNLVYVNLANNGIKFIHSEAFSRLHSLEELNLSGNLVVNLPSKLPMTLQILNLNNNANLNVSTLISLSPNLAVSDLDLSGCNIASLPRDIFINLPDLTYLNISHNFIGNLYFPFVLRQLHYLDVSHNLIHGPLYENLLGSCSNLETLHLSWNVGLELPEGGLLGDLTSVYLMDISGCNMSSLRASSIQGLTGLAHLNLSHNALQTFPKDVFTLLPHLNKLDLSFNELNYLPSSLFIENYKLSHLSLASNPQLFEVKNQLLENNHLLKSIDFSNCGMTDIPQLTQAKNLQILNLANNKLEDAKKLYNLTKTSLLSLDSIEINGNPWRCDFDFKQLVALLRDRQVKQDDFATWSQYQEQACLADREIILQTSGVLLRPREVLRSHFWSLLTFSFTLMVSVVAVGVAMVMCKRGRGASNGRNYRHLSESSSPGPIPAVPNKIYKEPIEPCTFTTNFKFPVKQSQIPASYVSGNYHHGELIP